MLSWESENEGQVLTHGHRPQGKQNIETKLLYIVKICFA